MHQTGLKELLLSSFHGRETKSNQSEINVDQLANHDNARKMISDHQISSTFKNIRRTPLYFHNILLDFLAKTREFGVYTFSLTCSATEFHQTEIIQVVTRQYGQSLTEKQRNPVDWSTEINYLKRNQVTVARQVDYVFNQLWAKVIFIGMDPIGQILNFDG